MQVHIIDFPDGYRGLSITGKTASGDILDAAMNEKPAAGPGSNPDPQPSKPRWSDADHPGIDYQKKRAKLSALWWGILAVMGAVLVGLALVFGACVFQSRL